MESTQIITTSAPDKQARMLRNGNSETLGTALDLARAMGDQNITNAS
jgi:hypothetical protein